MCVLSISLVLFVLISAHGRHSGAQVHRGAEGKTDFPQPAAKPSPTEERPTTEILAQLRSLRGRIETLEMREKVLRRQARALSHDIKRLEGLLGGASGMKTKDPKGLDIDRVARTGGRPDPRDAMVSMAGMVAVWRQIDAILAKLDEITTALSGPS
jgi:hypothetical protein